MAQLVQQDVPSTLLSGAVEGKTILIHCSGCDKPLVYVWANNPDVNADWKIVAECAYCEDRSFPIEIHGAFGVCGYHKDEQRIIDVTGQDFINGKVVLQTQQVRNI